MVRTGCDERPVNTPVPVLWVQISAMRRSVLTEPFLNPLNTELNPSANSINNQLAATVTVY